LRVLGSVGEPINPEAWKWYYEEVGKKNVSVVDTFWQTESGGIMLTPLPGCTPQKPGAATLPFFGVVPALMDFQGKEIIGNNKSGVLCFKKPWPGISRTCWGDHERYLKTYMTAYPGMYFTGDGCFRDNDGYIWITGRVDDVINVSGHRIGSAEIESALVSHQSVAESAVIGIPHEIKGQGLFAFVTLKDGVTPTAELIEALKIAVKDNVGSFAKPDDILITPVLPKTRSGKIMRRLLRKIACKETDSLGDTSTLADPNVVHVLIEAAAKLESEKHQSKFKSRNSIF
jgi:acetyl-CoA synthetase